jgi:AraC-like DNA-binding protein
MNEIEHIKTVSDYNNIIGLKTKHPLVSVVDFSKVKKTPKKEAVALSFGFYSVFFKEAKNCTLKYGRSTYDYQEGSLIFIAPNQIVSIEDDGDEYIPNGFALLFHPDLLHRTSLAQDIKEFSFFSYSISESLHLSENERLIVQECFSKIEYEISGNVDKHSKEIIVANIELFLKYCVRFYDRQFISRDDLNFGIVERFEKLLHNYFKGKEPELNGTPTVVYCANVLNLSPNYFGDLIKKETGKSAQEYIHTVIIDIAKEMIFDINKSISQIAYELGFKYPHHFTRLFKQKVGQSPIEYRKMI